MASHDVTRVTPPALAIGCFLHPGGIDASEIGPALYPHALSRADFILGYTDFRAKTPILEGKMPEFAKSDQPSKGGRAPFNPTAKQRDRVALLAAGGIPQPAIAAMLGCCERTLRNYFGAELEMGRGVKRAENLERLEAAAKGGSIGAMKTLEAIFGHAETKQLQGKSKAAPQPSKRVLAQRAAATAGGARTPWGSDLDWSNGGRPQ